jgi:hypothetical protein
VIDRAPARGEAVQGSIQRRSSGEFQLFKAFNRCAAFQAFGKEIKGQTFTSRLSSFSFRSSITRTLTSTPQLLAHDRRAVAQGAQLGPGDLWMDAAA